MRARKIDYAELNGLRKDRNIVTNEREKKKQLIVLCELMGERETARLGEVLLCVEWWG